MSTTEQAVGAPTSLAISGRLFIIAKPTAADELHIQNEYKRQCRAMMRTPLQSFSGDLATFSEAQKDGKPALHPNVIKMIVDAAVAQQAASVGGLAEPSDDRILEQTFTPEGAAYRVWYLARKAEPDLKLSDVSALINAGNVDQVTCDMFAALGVDDGKDDSKKKAMKTIGEDTC